jgi:hypothetical protein
MNMPTRSADVTYHGIQDDEQVNATFSGRIFVEQSKTGPTERETAKTLRELAQGRGTGWSGLQFGWGYNGTGTSAAARAILADAMGAEPGDDLREDFAADVLTYLCDEWRLRQGAVLRWVRGWYAEHGISPLPSSVANLPPALWLPWSRSLCTPGRCGSVTGRSTAFMLTKARREMLVLRDTIGQTGMYPDRPTRLTT